MRFNVGDSVTYQMRNYTITGGALFRDVDDGSVWEEYSLLDVNRQQWWFTDEIDGDEITLSQLVPSSRLPSQKTLQRASTATVIEIVGDYDAELGEEVAYQDFSGIPNEKEHYSIERWDSETEYCAGYYIPKTDIIYTPTSLPHLSPAPLTYFNDGTVLGNPAAMYTVTDPNGPNLNNTSNTPQPKRENQAKKYRDWLGIGLFFVLLFTLGRCDGSDSHAIENYLESTGATPISSTASDEAAKAYDAKLFWIKNTTTRTVAQNIIKNVRVELHASENNERNDDTIVLLSEKEYALIYSVKDDGVYVMVVPRTRKGAPHITPLITRTKALQYHNDLSHYISTKQKINEADFSTDLISQYARTRAQSIREESESSRGSSSGGGTSYGK